MKDERVALKLSAAAYLGVGALGIFFALLASSDAILLSGFFSLISFVMGLLSLKVAELVQAPADERFQFGYDFFEPLLNAIKGLIIVAVCAISLVSALDALVHGGRELNAGWALVYAVAASAVCFIVAGIQSRVARTANSPLLEVDVKNWTLDGYVNAGVGVAFLVAIALGRTRWSFLVPYVDPALLTVLVLVLVWVPLKTVKDSVLDLLQNAPDLPMQSVIRERVDAALEGQALANRHVRMLKVGRFVYVMCQLVVPSSFRLSRVKELDDVRRRIADGLAGVHPNLVLDAVFTEDEDWVQ